MKPNININDLHISIYFLVIFVHLSVMLVIIDDWPWFGLFVRLGSRLLRLDSMFLAFVFFVLLSQLRILLFNWIGLFNIHSWSMMLGTYVN
jgi:hypothetical protein